MDVFILSGFPYSSYSSHGANIPTNMVRVIAIPCPLPHTCPVK